jgi:Protein of unknown function (DUF4435)
MSDVEALKKAAYSSNYTYLKILQKYKFDSEELHYVFEGFEDHSFYFNFLSTLCPNYCTYISHGKKQSIELYQKLDWAKYDKEKILIFIDRDYGRILEENIPTDVNIYETTYYSIENYIADEAILRRLISEIAPIVAKYSVQLDRFLDHIKPVIAWILIVRNHNLKANLNSIDLGKLYGIDQNLFFFQKKINKLAYLERVTQTVTPEVPFSVFKSWYLNIAEQSSYKLYLRGKFEMWFLLTFFNNLSEFLQSNFGHDSKQKTYVNASNAIEIIGPRTSLPIRLHEFLQNFRRHPS